MVFADPVAGTDEIEGFKADLKTRHSRRAEVLSRSSSIVNGKKISRPRLIKVENKIYLVARKISKVPGGVVQKDFLIGKDYQEILLRYPGQHQKDERILTRKNFTAEFKNPYGLRFRNIKTTEISKKGVLQSEYILNPIKNKYLIVSMSLDHLSVLHDYDDKSEYYEVGKKQTLSEDDLKDSQGFADWMTSLKANKTAIDCRLEQTQRLIFDQSCFSTPDWQESQKFIRGGLSEILGSDSDSSDKAKYLGCLNKHNMADVAAKIEKIFLQLESEAEVLEANDKNSKSTPTNGGCSEPPALTADKVQNDRLFASSQSKEAVERSLVNCSQSSVIGLKGTQFEGDSFLSITQNWKNIGATQVNMDPVFPTTSDEISKETQAFGTVSFHELLHLGGIRDENLCHTIDTCCAFESGDQKGACDNLDKTNEKMRQKVSALNFMYDVHKGDASGGEGGQLFNALNVACGKEKALVIQQDMYSTMGSQVYQSVTADFVQCLSRSSLPATTPSNCDKTCQDSLKNSETNCYQNSTKIFVSQMKSWASTYYKNNANGIFQGCQLDSSKFSNDLVGNLVASRVSEDAAAVKKLVDGSDYKGPAQFLGFLQVRYDENGQLAPAESRTFYCMDQKLCGSVMANLHSSEKEDGDTWNSGFAMNDINAKPVTEAPKDFPKEEPSPKIAQNPTGNSDETPVPSGFSGKSNDRSGQVAVATPAPFNSPVLLSNLKVPNDNIIAREIDPPRYPAAGKTPIERGPASVGVRTTVSEFSPPATPTLSEGPSADLMGPPAFRGEPTASVPAPMNLALKALSESSARAIDGSLTDTNNVISVLTRLNLDGLLHPETPAQKDQLKLLELKLSMAKIQLILPDGRPFPSRLGTASSDPLKCKIIDYQIIPAAVLNGRCH
jgi:hypothetical protein